MIEATNILVLFFGCVLIFLSLSNFARSFAVWCALFPIVLRLTPLVVIPSCRFITCGLFLVGLIKFIRIRNRPKAHGLWWGYSLFLSVAFISGALSSQPVE